MSGPFVASKSQTAHYGTKAILDKITWKVPADGLMISNCGFAEFDESLLTGAQTHIRGGWGKMGSEMGFEMSVKKGPELFSFSPSILLNLLFCLAICSIFELEAAISTVLQHFGVRTYHFP